MVTIGINGFGRTGRMALRASFENSYPHRVVHINDCNMDINQMMYLLKYDTVHGKFNGCAKIENDSLVINNQIITVSSHKEIKDINWKQFNVQYVIESTGKHITFHINESHIAQGAEKVIIAAPATDTPMFVMGVNHNHYTPEMNIISNASCNTNCLSLLAKVLHNEFGIIQGLMTTVHSITGTQQLVDGVGGKDRRRGRSGAFNICPSSTGAAKAVGKVIPDLQGKLNGMALRVPTIDVCLVDFTVQLAKKTNLDLVLDKVKQYSEQGDMVGFLGYTKDDIVSSDIIGNSLSCVYDYKSSMQLNETFFKFIIWTDNEYAYSCRLLDMISHVSTIVAKSAKL